MTYGDLPDTIGLHHSDPRKSAQLRCLDCSEESFSANRGDYWDRLEEVATCAQCGESLTYGRTVWQFLDISPVTGEDIP